MTVLEAISQTKDENGNIIIPVGATRGETDVPGVVTEAWLREVYGDSLDAVLPISSQRFTALKHKVEGNWESCWQWYRDQFIITVA